MKEGLKETVRWEQLGGGGGRGGGTYDGDIITDLRQDFVNNIVENCEGEENRDIWNISHGHTHVVVYRRKDDQKNLQNITDFMSRTI